MAFSGVLVGQIYRDFAGKEDIVVAIAERDAREFLHDRELRRALDEGDRPALRCWIARFVASEEKATDRPAGGDHRRGVAAGRSPGSCGTSTNRCARTCALRWPALRRGTTSPSGARCWPR
ncbi:hypothetical protein AB5I41_13460 [Sphingomonas sp. MMS24-JH45]